MTSAEHSLIIVRAIDSSADDLYAAWTDPAVMRRWMAKTVDADVRVGGRYRHEIDAGGQTFIHSGEYLVLEPGQRIVQTFHGGSGEPNPDHREFLAVVLRPLGPEQTELTFVDSWDGAELDEEDLEATKQAWNGWLDQLARLF